MAESLFIVAALGFKALVLMYTWLAGCIVSSELSRSKGYGERPGLGTGLFLSALAVPIWLAIPPKDNLAEWHTRKPVLGFYGGIALTVATVIALIIALVS